MPEPAILNALAASPLFKALTPQAMERVASIARRLRFSDGGLIHGKGDPFSGLFGVLSGSVKVSSGTPDGREAILTFLEPGQWFGEIGLFDGDPRTHDATAVGVVDMLHLPRDAFLALLVGMPELYPHFLRLLAQRLRTALALIEESALLPLPARLARRLLHLAQAYGIPAPSGLVRIGLHLPQEQLAAMLGASRQTINKELRNWERQGWIRIDYGRLLIRPDALSTLIEAANDLS